MSKKDTEVQDVTNSLTGEEFDEQLDEHLNGSAEQEDEDDEAAAIEAFYEAEIAEQEAKIAELEAKLAAAQPQPVAIEPDDEAARAGDHIKVASGETLKVKVARGQGRVAVEDGREFVRGTYEVVS